LEVEGLFAIGRRLLHFDEELIRIGSKVNGSNPDPDPYPDTHQSEKADPD
jgi:hypothetical protein